MKKFYLDYKSSAECCGEKAQKVFRKESLLIDL